MLSLLQMIFPASMLLPEDSPLFSKGLDGSSMNVPIGCFDTCSFRQGGFCKLCTQLGVVLVPCLFKTTSCEHRRMA